ncbi:MAG: DUF2520 domain-containing protein [Saprospiraceae bacterium]|nr:DUF2520 domain-containing protein [Saprospiraceae bacterium]
MKIRKKKISIIGTGNVATHLAVALSNVGHDIACIYGRSEKSAKILSDKVSSNYISNIKEIPIESDLIIVSISDDVIKSLIQKLNFGSTLIIHTSGTVGMEILKKSSENYGVFYPLQTFSKDKYVDFTNIPICIESNNENNLQLLYEIGESISNDIRKINSEQRKIIHLAAVFACNFTNYLYSIADEILESEGIAFDILKPLILETSNKIISNKPADVQTGPASRCDFEIIQKHLEQLKKKPEFKKIYDLLSQNIIEKHKQNE